MNPATGEVLRVYEALNNEALEAKLALAAEAYVGYTAVPLEHKGLWLKKLAGILESETEDLAAMVTQEVGKTLTAARAGGAEVRIGVPVLRGPCRAEILA